ncbi:hypothetical protein O3M35_005277 [Rhynocoris fuscipes]|uniref:Uncharacterized protein n=1 Tax=Rhynocoris fuscipes TaxID=488301 RepID=A0AAW1DPV2_9HEMI
MKSLTVRYLQTLINKISVAEIMIKIAIMDLTESLNKCNTNVLTCKISELNVGVPYQVRKFEKFVNQFGEGVAAYLSSTGDEGERKVYVPKRFHGALSNSVIENYNSDNGNDDKIYLEYRGLRKPRGFDVVFKKADEVYYENESGAQAQYYYG